MAYILLLIKLHLIVDILQDVSIKYHDPIESSMGVQTVIPLDPIEIVGQTILNGHILL